MPIYKTKDKNKQGQSRYNVRINYTDSFGAHKQLTRSAWGLSAAKELERQLSQQTDEKKIVLGITVQQLYEEFLNSSQSEIRRSTVRGYVTNFTNHILPVLGNQRLTSLNVRTLNNWKNYINSKPISLVTKKNIYGALRVVLNYAVKLEYIPSNPLLKVGNFKDSLYQKPEMQFYTPDEFKAFIAAALTARQESGYYDYYIFFMLRYYTGARKGELHALRWNCIDGNKMYIKRSISQKIKGDDVETPPKNKSSVRTVQLPEPMLNALKIQKENQQQKIKDWNENGFVCGYYRPLRDTAIENENKKYAAMSGVKKIRIHDFRHSHASLLINAGINALEVAHRLGHSTVDQTLKTYSHLFPTEADKALNVLNNI